MSQTGDFNQDGRIDGNDIALLRTLLQGNPQLSAHLSAEEFALLDVNHDGHIDQDDLAALYQKLLLASDKLSLGHDEKLGQLRNKLKH